MNTTERLLSLSLACALAACQGGPAPAELDDDPGPTADQADGEEASGAAGGDSPRDATPPRVVTLITGHRVTVRAGRAITVDPPASGGSTAVRSVRSGAHLYVIPSEAERLVQRGLLDRRLFDVNELARLGYDDDHRDDLPIIVQYRSGAVQRGAAVSALAAAGARQVRSLASIGGAAMRAPKRGAPLLWAALAGGGARGAAPALADGVARIWLDGARRTFLDQSAPQIGAPAAWAAGLTGQGVTVAVLDTGIEADHPDFAGRIADSRSFIEGVPEAIDDFGHGTHVASILAGSGAAEGGRYRGIAPDALILNGKVCDESGSCPDSAIIAGMEWAAESGAAVANLSLGGPDAPEIDPLEEAINTLTAEHGILFVAAAGNFPQCGGSDALQVGSPSTADAALSVGAVDRDDETAGFSCRGPRSGDGAIKPDISAPGVDIVAGRAPGTPVGDFDPVDDFYARLSGTSMATPHVAGAAALLAQQRPDWRAGEIKAALMASATPTSELGVQVEGTGRVDLARAIVTDVFTSPANLHLGSAAWPHDDDEPIARAVTYQNRGASPVTLQLALDVRDPAGAPAGDGMFALEPAEVTVPAGGEAQVIITADTRVPGPDGAYGGVLVASSADRTVRTLVSVSKEVESHELTVDIIDREGSPHDDVVLLFDLEIGDLLFIPSSTPVRLRRASYVVDATFFGQEADGDGLGVMLVQPRLDLDGPTTITMDGRTAQPVQITVPVRAARRVLEVVEYSTLSQVGGFSAALLIFDDQARFGSIYTGQVGPPTPVTLFETAVTSIWARRGPNRDDRFFDSPYVYNTTFLASSGGFPTGFVRQVTAADLAIRRNDFSRSAPGLVGSTVDFGLAPGSSIGSIWGASTSFHLPFKRTSYYLAGGVQWQNVSRETPPGDFSETELETPFRTLEAGSNLRAHWNQAVIGPSMSTPGGGSSIARFGDEIDVFGPSYYSDQANHYGFSWVETGSARLFRDGELVGESASPSFAFFPVEPEAADYRLEVQSIRGGSAELSTQVDLAWTFRSSSTEATVLPTLAARFLPELDDRNSAPRGETFSLPIVISRQQDGTTAPIERLRIDVSYDRGQRWRRVTVVRFGDLAVATFDHPRKSGDTVSLRARAADEDGNTVEQVILDAYRLRPLAEVEP